MRTNRAIAFFTHSARKSCQGWPGQDVIRQSALSFLRPPLLAHLELAAARDVKRSCTEQLDVRQPAEKIIRRQPMLQVEASDHPRRQIADGPSSDISDDIT